MQFSAIKTFPNHGKSNFQSISHSLKRLCQHAVCAVVAITGLGVAAPASELNEFHVGVVFQTSANFCPRFTIEARGQELDISRNNALFSFFGTMYGGDGRTTFGVPDLTGSDDNPPAFGSKGLRWCVVEGGKWPERDGAASFTAASHGLIMRTGANFCPHPWRKTTSDTQTQSSHFPLTNCEVGTDYEIDHYGWLLGQIVTVNAPNCPGNTFPANGQGFKVDSNTRALEAVFDYAYGGEHGVSFNLPNIPTTSAGTLSCVVIQGIFPSRP